MSDPNAIFADKEKMFEYVLKNNLPSSLWKSTIIDLLSKDTNDWIYQSLSIRAKDNPNNDS